MKSRWHHLKEEALSLRRAGTSMTSIERDLGIPRSTLSGWFKNILLTEDQRMQLMKNSSDGWAQARINATAWHNQQKQIRLEMAQKAALKTMRNITVTNEVLDLAFAMLYLGEGAKSGTTSLASSDPKILRFALAVLKRNYGVTTDQIRFELHLRMDQDKEVIKAYWAKMLDAPLERFTYIAYDKRTSGRPTYTHYKGVCVLQCGRIAIQRKLIYLYNLFCDHVAALD